MANVPGAALTSHASAGGGGTATTVPGREQVTVMPFAVVSSPFTVIPPNVLNVKVRRIVLVTV